MSSKLVAGGVLAVVGLITLKVLAALFAVTIGVFGFLFKLIPMLVIAWVIWRIIKYIGRPSTAEI